MLPKKKPFKEGVYSAYDVGWNDCIDEIREGLKLLRKDEAHAGLSISSLANIRGWNRLIDALLGEDG